MLESPNLPDDAIIQCLRARFGLAAVDVRFLPLGADINAAVFRVTDAADASYFLKLRRGHFDDTPVTVARFLADQGITAVIAPLTAMDGQLWTVLDEFMAVLYPFVEGENGYVAHMTESHWQQFGATMRQIHHVDLPSSLAANIRRERFDPGARQSVRRYLTRFAHESFADPLTAQLAEFLHARRDIVFDLVNRAAEYAHLLQDEPRPFVLCHSDTHAGNVLLGPGDAFHIVDWDEPILAPKERDLMYPGGGQGFRGHSAAQEITLFFQGYGEAEVNAGGITYYRVERIVQDIAALCDQLVLSSGGDANRRQAFHWLKANFVPGGVIEISLQS
ncbi:phosphotransferase [bacterium]|nr:phosphotransferase [bacterium]